MEVSEVYADLPSRHPMLEKQDVKDLPSSPWPLSLSDKRTEFSVWMMGALRGCFTLSFLGVEWRRPFQGSHKGTVGFESLVNGWVQLWWKLNINPNLFRNVCWAFPIPLFLQLWWNYPPFKNDTVGIRVPLFPSQTFQFGACKLWAVSYMSWGIWALIGWTWWEQTAIIYTLIAPPTPTSPHT